MKAKLPELFFILASSLFIVGMMIMGGLYSLNEGAFIQSFVEELSRCIFCYIVFKATGHLIYASFAFSTSEFIFSSLINLLIFSPTYFTEMSQETVVAYASITCSALIGFIAGFIYKENAIKGYSIFWGVFMTFPMKYVLRSYPNGLISENYGNAYDLYFYGIYVVLLSAILLLLIRRIKLEK